MYQIKDNTIKISVRNLVEFIMRGGDIDNRTGGSRDTDAMREGSKIHRMIQKRMGSNYSAEVPLSIKVPINQEEHEIMVQIDGRADGIIYEEEGQPHVIIDEIKGVYQDLIFIKEPVKVHLAQGMCYGYIYATQMKLDRIGVRMTYCNMDTKALKYFEEEYEYKELQEWFDELMKEFEKWVIWQYHWIKTRNETIKNLEFPFAYRVNQKKLVLDVYRTILRDKKVYIEAPTGVGKTISTIFPAVKAMGEEITSKIFYLTAKTITRTVAEETYRVLKSQGLRMKVVTITAKDKICILDKADCNPIVCEHAKGHYDRVNDAVYDLLTHEEEINRNLIVEYAIKHKVCPFEMSLDVTLWADGVICDYNYAFDPNVYLRRFFVNEKKNDYIFLIDEAHNLVDRAREMYSGEIFKDQLLECKRIVKKKSSKLSKRIEISNKDFLKLKRECDDFQVLEDINDIVFHLLRLVGEFDDFLQEFKSFDERDKVLQLYFDIGHFLNMFEILDEKYVIYTDYDDTKGFRLRLQCMDPSTNLLRCLEKGRSAVFFSATLLPVDYYKSQLGGGKEDYAIYTPSPFEKKNRLIMIGRDISTKYSRRSRSEYEKILDYISSFTKAKVGNYLVFFPSYQMMNQLLDLMKSRIEEREELEIEEKENEDFIIFDGRNPEQSIEIVTQRSNMTERDREEFLESFVMNPKVTHIGFCVMGGIFSEGIDLTGDRLIGAVIVGTGLPMVCNERELFRSYYDEKASKGFEYAYLYNGMNKVLQSGGRVIRTMEDKGAILLLDERFLNKQYQSLFPREWFPNNIVDRFHMNLCLEEFWKGAEQKK